MTVYRPGKSPYYHYDFVVKGKRYHGSTHCSAKRDALAFEARVRTDAALPKRERPPIRLDEACGLRQARTAHKPSWPNIDRCMTALCHGLGKATLLSEISQHDLDLYFAKRRAGRCDASVNREINEARAVWRGAMKNRFDIGEMPDWAALSYKVEEVERPELTFEQEARLFTELRLDVSDAVDFALKSGWRRGEVIGLRWSDCDLAGGYAMTRIKGGNVIRRPITPTLVAIIANQPKVGPFVFTYVCRKNRGKRRKGERYPLSATVLRQAFEAARKAIDLPGFRIHDLRHTRGTRIVRATGSLPAAQKALAHRSIKTTMRYAHVLDNDVRYALEASESRNSPGPAQNESAESANSPKQIKGVS